MRGLLIVLTLLSVGCTATYRQTVAGNHKAKPLEGSGLSGTFNHNRHRVELMDHTGGLCSSIATMGDAAGARDEAIEEGKWEYRYKVYRPDEFAIMQCGFYYQWGNGEGFDGDFVEENSRFTSSTTRTLSREGGFRVSFDHGFGGGLGGWFNMDLGIGGYRFDGLWNRYESRLDADKFDTKVFLRWTFEYYLRFAPEFFYGFGLFAGGGIDIGKLFKKPHYGGGVDFIYPIIPALALRLHGEFRHDADLASATALDVAIIHNDFWVGGGILWTL